MTGQRRAQVALAPWRPQIHAMPPKNLLTDDDGTELVRVRLATVASDPLPCR
jgi:hypothetical protein